MINGIVNQHTVDFKKSTPHYVLKKGIIEVRKRFTKEKKHGLH